MNDNNQNNNNIEGMANQNLNLGGLSNENNNMQLNPSNR